MIRPEKHIWKEMDAEVGEAMQQEMGGVEQRVVAAAKDGRRRWLQIITEE